MERGVGSRRNCADEGEVAPNRCSPTSAKESIRALTSVDTGSTQSQPTTFSDSGLTPQHPSTLTLFLCRGRSTKSRVGGLYGTHSSSVLFYFALFVLFCC